MGIRMMLPGFYGGGSSGGTAGPNSPGTMAAVNDGSSKIAWQNVNNAVSSNNSYAAVPLLFAAGNDQSHYLKATNFGFSIPGGATITGIKVEVERKCSSTGGGNVTKDRKVVLVKAGTILTVNKATTTAWTTSDVVASYGGAGDLWSDTWTPSDINDSGFGVAFASQMTAGDFSSIDSMVDHIKVTVYYTT